MEEFNDTLLEAGLEDLRFGGQLFTWHNSRASGHILRKLDRALVNPFWLNTLDHASAEFLPFGLSDHSPIVVDLGIAIPIYRCPFKFFNYWTEFDEFYPLIDKVWNTPVEGYAMFKVYKKLKLVKAALKELCKRKNMQIEGDLEPLRVELAELQNSIASGADDPELIAKERHCASKLAFACKGVESYARQRSRIQWLKEGDQNTAFFFNSIKGRHNVNKILSIQDENGLWIREKDQIANNVVDFYKSLLGTESDLPCNASQVLRNYVDPIFNSDQLEMLGAKFTDEEIKASMFSLHPNKAPGPDGFNAFFFQNTWSIVGSDVITAIQEFFSSSILLKEANSTIIALIPKVPNASKLKDFRPISCCNTLYKCISKLLANRLKQVLPAFINDAQAAFVEGRHIGDNILMAQELVRGYHLHSSSPRCAIKVDLMKAFDSVRWDFLWDSLHYFGFPKHFICWIKACVTTPRYSVSINGELNGFFAGKKGLRQGDPMSPYLFVICMEVFSRILNMKIRNSLSFKFHWRCRKARLSHLCFADDLMVFCRGNLESIMVVKDALTTFTSLSGLQPNISKSTIFLSGIDDIEKDEIVSKMGFPLGTFPIRYLGVPLISTKLKASDCKALEDRILRRIKSWTNRFLSFAGRLQLIHSVLFSIQSFWCSHFVLPAKITKSIESLLSAFLWNGVSLRKHGAKVAWTDITKPKVEGGLGIKSIKEWNYASMTRYIWLICQPCSNSLWAKWVKQNLLNKEQFWVAKVPWNSSWTWRKILKLRNQVKSFISVKIGNGINTSLWFDSWMPRGPICSSPHARVIYDSGLTKDAKVCDIISSGAWAWPIANSNDLIILKEETVSLPPPICSREDEVTWKGSKDFSIKAVWNTIRTPSSRVIWSHIVWFKFSIPRHSFILWLALRERLSTQDRLMSFGIIQQMKCLLCGDDIEDHNHLFFDCSYSYRIWLNIISKCGLTPYTSSWLNVKPWVCKVFKGVSLQSIIGRLAFAASIYFLWQERNARMHEGSHHNELHLLSMIMDTVSTRLSDSSGFPCSPLNLQLISSWNLPTSLIGV